MITTEQYNELCSIARRKYPQNGIDILHDYIIEFNEDYKKIRAYLYTQGYYPNIKYRTENEKEKTKKRVLETPKKCSCCKEEKTPNEFYTHTHGSTGRVSLSFLCKECLVMYRKKYKTDNKERIKEANKRYYAKNKEKICLLKKLRIANETPDEKEKRLAKNREYFKKFIANETPKQRKKRLIKDCENYKKRIANETPEQREKRLIRYREYDKKRIANETPEKREIRLAKKREYYKKQIANETPEQKEIRLSKYREYYKKYREKKRLNKEQTKG